MMGVKNLSSVPIIITLFIYKLVLLASYISTVPAWCDLASVIMNRLNFGLHRCDQAILTI